MLLPDSLSWSYGILLGIDPGSGMRRTMFEFFSKTLFGRGPGTTPPVGTVDDRGERHDLGSTKSKKASGARVTSNSGDKESGGTVKVLKKGPAMRVIFFYPGEEGTYVDNADVTLYENGIIHIKSNQEESTTHLQNCEILWSFETEADDRTNKVRLLKPKSSPSSSALPGMDTNDSENGKGPGDPDQGPKLT